jgi:hypothetical protein
MHIQHLEGRNIILEDTLLLMNIRRWLTLVRDLNKMPAESFDRRLMKLDTI